jgi:Alpha-amylase C-terminal beta-sheet domain
MPCILWEHYFDYGLAGKIDTLLDVRRRNGINATSAVEIQVAEVDIYVAKIGDRWDGWRGCRCFRCGCVWRGSWM